MHGILRRLFSSKHAANDEIRHGTRVAELVVPMIAATVKSSGFNHDLFPHDNRSHPMIGFVCGLCDVLVQAMGGKTKLSSDQAVLIVLEELLKTDASFFTEAVQNPPLHSEWFNMGSETGSTCAFAILKGESDESTELIAKLFIEVYGYCCSPASGLE